MLFLSGWLAATIVALLIILAVLRFQRARFDDGPRELLMRVSGWLQGLETVIIAGPDALPAHEALLHGGVDKGRMIEENMMLPVWHGAFSIESCNGEQWRRGRAAFDHLLVQLPSLSDLEKRFLCAPLPETDLIDSPSTVRMTMHVFLAWLFGDHRVSPSDLEALLECCEAYRQDLAMRGHASDAIKLRGAHITAMLLAESSYELPPGCEMWQGDEVALSSIFQPFVISPGINFIDIICSLADLTDIHAAGERWVQVGYPAAKAEMQAYICEAIRLQHPFPVLERQTQTTQYFICLDRFFANGDSTFDPARWLRPHATTTHQASLLFGCGPRKCPGKAHALAALPALLFRLVSAHVQGTHTLRPLLHHQHSGRVMDGAPTTAAAAFDGARKVIGALLDVAFRSRRAEFCPPRSTTESLGKTQ